MGICGSNPVPVAESEADAVAMELNNAFRKMVGADENALISSLSSRTSAVLEAVPAAYAKRYSEGDEVADVFQDIKDETRFADFFTNLSSDFTKTMVRLLTPQAVVEAKSMRAAMKCGINIFGTDELRLEEVLFFRSKEQIDAIKEAYEELYGEEPIPFVEAKEGEEIKVEFPPSEESQARYEEYKASLGESSCALERDIRSEVSALLLRMYLAALNDKDNVQSPEATAAALYNAGQGKDFGTDEAAFAELLGRAGPEHISQVKKIYYQQYNRELSDMINMEMGMFEMQLKKAALRVVGVLDGDRDKDAHPQFLALRILKAAKHKSVETFGTGLGTDDQMLQRLLITNRESGILSNPRDPISRYNPVFPAISEWLKEKVPPGSPCETLRGIISDETSGHYEELLLGIVNKFSQPVNFNDPRNQSTRWA